MRLVMFTECICHGEPSGRRGESIVNHAKTLIYRIRLGVKTKSECMPFLKSDPKSKSRKLEIENLPFSPLGAALGVDGLFPIGKDERGIRSRALTIRENGSRAVEASRPSGSADAQDLAHGRSSSGRGLPRGRRAPP